MPKTKHLICPAVGLLFLALPCFAQSAPSSVAPPVEVPFGCGYTFPVSQTHNTGSHLQNDVWAWDFRMPEGTPITAARPGTVRMARGDSSEGGCDPKFAGFANYVVVDHGDGLETQYLHFSQVTVKAGEHVKAGTLLGYSGKTGWACGAHLHFKVARHLANGWNNPSVPARFVTYGDPELESLVSSPVCGGARVFVATRPPSEIPAAAVRNALASATGTPARAATRAGAVDAPTSKLEGRGAPASFARPAASEAASAVSGGSPLR